MEVTLKATRGLMKVGFILSFNPCFNGSDSKSLTIPRPLARGRGFNPCFNGSDSKSSVDLGGPAD